MNVEELKFNAANAAIRHITPHLMPHTIIGVGTGSTANYFIDLLATVREKFDGAVASSNATAARLASHNIPVYDLNVVSSLPFYIDGADEINQYMQMIKGGGGAFTREKIVAAAADKVLCIADERKYVDLLGRFPIPVEVIPLARSLVGRALLALGGNPIYRQGVITDEGNIILDAFNLTVTDPVALEQRINQITGVVTNGLFAAKPADLLILSRESGSVDYLTASTG